MAEAILRLDDVVKRFAGHTAVQDLSMEVPAGGIFGLLGPNGAGKTTTIRMIMNVITPDAGRITLFGGPASRSLAARVGFLPEERGLYKKMRVLDHLVFFGQVKGLTARAARAEPRMARPPRAGRLGLAQGRGPLQGHAAEGAVHQRAPA